MRRFLGATGRVLVTVGILLLLFVAYQLWGTGIYQARAQDRLETQFRRDLHRAGTPRSTTTTSRPDDPTVTALPATVTTAPPTADIPPNGDAVGRITIPKIGVDQIVVEGVDVEDLRKGPGHYPGTPLPGQEGNAAIAGHRTTYGAPFGDLDQLAKDDVITVQTVQGTFDYRVDEDPFAVDPSDRDVLLPTPGTDGSSLATLTLTTCNPKYSAAQRLIVKASLRLPPGVVPLPPTGVTKAPKTISGLSGEPSSRGPALLWGIIAALVGLLWWFVFHRYPRWTTWIVGVVPFLVVLFVFYTYLERMLPSNY